MNPRSCADAATFAADVALEGPPEVEFNPGIAGRIAAKPVAAGVLLRDGRGHVAFVVPRYKPFLEIPGGMVDANESPKAACVREVREELGLDLAVGALLVVDWVPRNGVWRDSQQFVFDGGVLDQPLTARDSELSGVDFLSLDAAEPRIHPSLHRRLLLAVRAASSGETVYAEFGRPV
ncbi:NUDIX hydrolase [Lentzea sp. NBRC 105346]|uniref:NUDIX domain-containing protein n=1 Tax=Lentzea sp. NBRC 105346 TaxID=3032205 RepID=UPI0024A474B7|nr:NUDIX hydrolase [Lentzea sp. NBRC 105346]GLZ33425.1 NUDIX hydrolase [Lentzea sp. NBRC 105346]